MHTWSAYASTAGHHRAQHTCDCRGRERKHCHLRWLHSCCLVKSELFHRISGDECSTTWLSAATIGSASSLTAHAVSSLLHSLDGSRRIHLVAVTTTGTWIWHHLDIVHTNGNKLILSLELTEHTWISRDVGGDQISCTLIWGSKFPNERLSFIFPTKGTCVSVTLSRLYICKNVHVRDHFVIFAFVRSSQ